MSIKAVEYFLLNHWLWGMMWGIYHIPVNILLMMLLLKVIARFKIVPSILLAFFSKVFSVIAYALTILVLVYVVKLEFVFPKEIQSYKPINPLLASVYLGIIYAFFQTVFFWIVSRFYSINVGFMAMIALVSNFISAILVYKFVSFT